MESLEDFKKAMDMHKQMVEEDKQNFDKLRTKETEFVTSNKLTAENFNNLYSEAEKNFRFEIGSACEEVHDQVIEALKLGENKKHMVDEFMACVDKSREKVTMSVAEQQRANPN